LIDYQKPGLSRWQESFVSTFFFQIHPFITLAALYSAYIAVRRRDLKYVVVIWLVLLVVLMQIKRIRYIIMVFPMLALMAAYGIQEIRERHIKSFFVSAAFISSLIVGVFAYLPFLQSLGTINFKDAGSFVNSLDEANVEVFTLMPEDPVLNPAASVPLLLFPKRISFILTTGSLFAARRPLRNPRSIYWDTGILNIMVLMIRIKTNVVVSGKS
jgi:hypothetical protein